MGYHILRYATSSHFPRGRGFINPVGENLNLLGHVLPVGRASLLRAVRAWHSGTSWGMCVLIFRTVKSWIWIRTLSLSPVFFPDFGHPWVYRFTNLDSETKVQIEPEVWTTISNPGFPRLCLELSDACLVTDETLLSQLAIALFVPSACQPLGWYEKIISVIPSMTVTVPSPDILLHQLFSFYKRYHNYNSLFRISSSLEYKLCKGNDRYSFHLLQYLRV